MADLREKIIARKLSSSCVEQVEVSGQRLAEERQPSGSTDDHHELVEKRGFRTPVQEVVDRDRSWGRFTEKKRKFGGTESPRGRSKYTPVRDQYPVGVRNYQIYDPEFDFRNNMRLGASFTDVKSEEEDLESCEKTYRMAKRS